MIGGSHIKTERREWHRLDIPTQWGIHFNLDYNQIYFDSNCGMCLALPQAQKAAGVAVGVPSRETVEQWGKPFLAEPVKPEASNFQCLLKETGSL